MRKIKTFTIAERIRSLLPYAYALTGTLYLAFELKKWYSDYSGTHTMPGVNGQYWLLWALGSILFWIPFFSKKTMISFVHSLPFFLLLLKDIFLRMNSAVSREDLRNEMITYTFSILLNLTTLLPVLLVNLFVERYRKE
ncbi:MAG TPA: hypothetical protein VMH01_15110 [Puia sp.]|nr:hypothetical protein [Puia sp.]